MEDRSTDSDNKIIKELISCISFKPLQRIPKKEHVWVVWALSTPVLLRPALHKIMSGTLMPF